MERMKLTPAKYAIYVFGSIRELARVSDRSPSNVHRWKTLKKGTIPSGLHKKILDVAKKRALDLTAEDLIFGRKV